MLALGALWGKRKKYFGVQTRPWGGSSEAPKNCARTPITYRPAQGTGLLRLQNKTAPEPLAAPELLVLQNKTAPEPPLPYFGGSTSKKTAPEPPLPYFGGSTSKKTAPEPPLPILLKLTRPRMHLALYIKHWG